MKDEKGNEIWIAEIPVFYCDQEGGEHERIVEVIGTVENGKITHVMIPTEMDEPMWLGVDDSQDSDEVNEARELLQQDYETTKL